PTSGRSLLSPQAGATGHRGRTASVQSWSKIASMQAGTASISSRISWGNPGGPSLEATSVGSLRPARIFWISLRHLGRLTDVTGVHRSGRTREPRPDDNHGTNTEISPDFRMLRLAVRSKFSKFSDCRVYMGHSHINPILSRSLTLMGRLF